MIEKGIVLAGGLGSRLLPITMATSKQLLPIYDKPMIYYPLTTLMSAGIRDICIVVDPAQESAFHRVLEDGQQWGINITYLCQESPEGIPQAFTIAEDFLEGKASCLILGDNLLVGSGLGRKLKETELGAGAKIFLYEVEDPTQYGNVSLTQDGHIEQIVEKPEMKLSPYAIPGIYFVDGTASHRVRNLKKSQRGEYEIVDLLKSYMSDGLLTSEFLSRGTAWLDTGTVEDLFSAAEFIRIIQKRQGQFIGCPEEVALRSGWISSLALQNSLLITSKALYGSNLRKLATQEWGKN